MSIACDDAATDMTRERVPLLRQVVLDSTDARMLAEFYRLLRSDQQDHNATSGA